MPRHPSLALAVRTLAVSALATCALAGCSRTPAPAGGTPATSSGAASSAAASPGTSGVGSPTPAGTPLPSSPAAAAGAGAGAGAAATSGATGTAAGAVSRCEPAHLSLSVAFPGGADPHGALLQFVNTGAAACRMSGFPGVDLLGPDDPTFGPTYEVPRASAAVPTVTLAPRSAAHAVLHFLTPQEGTRWVPTRISVTPPDTTRQLSSAWPTVAVLRQDAATHPGTYIGPVLAGAGTLAEVG